MYVIRILFLHHSYILFYFLRENYNLYYEKIIEKIEREVDRDCYWGNQ